MRPETGRTSDDLVPVITSFDFLSEGDKLKIFHKNPAKVFPKLANHVGGWGRCGPPAV